MRDRRSACYSHKDLEQGFWTQDAGIEAHVESCAPCRGQWEGIEGLAELSSRVDVPDASDDKTESMRAALLATVNRQAATPAASRSNRRWVAVVAAAAGVALFVGARAWLFAPAAPAALVSDAERGHVLVHGDARYMAASAQPDEVVRLVDGTLTVDVDPLQPGERFRVVVGDGEIEVKGTSFDVTAVDDRLVAVRVIHGIVEVRQGGRETVTLRAAERWRAPETSVAVDVVQDEAAPAPAAVMEQPGEPEARQPRRRARQTRRAPVAAPPSDEPQIQEHLDAGPAARLPSRAETEYEAGWSALRLGRYAVAATAFERCVSLSDDATLTAEASYWRAVALARAGRDAAAGRALVAFVDDNPGSARVGAASVMLGWMLYERGSYERAARRFRAAAADPDEAVRSSAEAGLEAVGRGAR